MKDPAFRGLAREASARYAPSDRFARHWAYGKLTGDPVFRHLLARGLLPPGGSVLDLGCGQAVLASLLIAARGAHAQGRWPADWPPPPNPRAIRGIELRERDVVRARHAAAGHAEFIHGDIRDIDFGRADAVVILDVLHYVDEAEQRDVLERVRHALHEGGVLLMRVAGVGHGWRYRATVGIDRLVMFLRGHGFIRLWNRPVPEWRTLLESLGFTVEEHPMSEGTPFANVLLVARYHP